MWSLEDLLHQFMKIWEYFYFYFCLYDFEFYRYYAYNLLEMNGDFSIANKNLQEALKRFQNVKTNYIRYIILI